LSLLRHVNGACHVLNETFCSFELPLPTPKNRLLA
jgi:hypothetical protein